MVRKRLDDRIRTLIEQGVVKNERSILVLVGDHGKDQVPNLHGILSKTTLQSRPNVLWCYKKELGFSTHRKKRIQKLKRDKSRGLTSSSNNDNNNSTADNFELFITSTDINWCYYKDSHRVLGTTVGMLVLQDFEALTPNLMARTIETVKGGGLVIFLLRTVQSLKQLYTMTMDVHSRYRTSSSNSGGDIVPRFNERFILSLAKCRNCLVCDDELNVLPISKKTLQTLSQSSSAHYEKGDAGEVILQESSEQRQLKQLKESLIDTPHVGVLIDLAKTIDQAKAVLVFLEACSEKTSAASTAAAAVSNNTSTIAMTAARGRGKSAAIGLCLAGAISLGYTTIAITAPEPENLVSVFDFVCRGLQALKFQEHLDYDITYNQEKTGRESTKCIIGIHVHRTHRQIIQYIAPTETDKFVTAEIVAIDEAAAIPLPIVKSLMMMSSSKSSSTSSSSKSSSFFGGTSNRLTFLSSTVNGYEGTGRALSLKLIKELRDAKGSAEIVKVANAAAGALSGPKEKKGVAKIHEQRYKAASEAAAAAASGSSSSSDKLTGRLREMELSTPIRYAEGDPVEEWLNKLLCLDCNASNGGQFKLRGGAPSPADCELYSVDRDALFSYHKLSESFLQKLMGLYTSAHYKNTPNDLQMLSDAPAHSVFVLLSPSAEKEEHNNKKEEGNAAAAALPDILAVVQVALEGQISRKTVEAQLARGHRSAGDLIPWTISQQFGDSKFAQLSGARIVRIAVHPSVQSMGYGSRAVELLYRFYNGEMISLGNDNDDDDDSDSKDSSSSSEEENETEEESIDSDNDDGKKESNKKDDKKKTKGIHGEKLAPRKELPPLLLPLTEIKAPKLDWIGTSFGLTLQLHKFWSRANMKMLYLRQTKNELTGEHSTIMVRALPKTTGVDDTWLHAFVSDTKRRFLSLLGGPFRDLSIRLAIAVLENMPEMYETSKNGDGEELSNNNDNTRSGTTTSILTAEELGYMLTPHDLKRLELYGRNLCDHHLVTDLLPAVARIYFTGRLGPDFKLSSVQAAILCGIGVQNHDVDSLAIELGLPANQVLAMFNKAIRKMSIALNTIIEQTEEKKSLLGGEKRRKVQQTLDSMKDVASETLEEDAANAAKDAMERLNNNNNESATKKSLPPSIAKDGTLMQYAIKGTDEQWDKALQGKEISTETSLSTSVQIRSVREKRKGIDESDFDKEAKLQSQQQPNSKKSKTNKKHKKNKGRKSN